MTAKIELKTLIKQLAIPVVTGALAGVLTMNSVKLYNATAEKPVFSPPDYIFPIVWTILYVLMGISAYLIDTSGAKVDLKKKALRIYYLQLAFNFVWSFLFFTFRCYLFSFIWLIALFALILAMIIMFHKINKTAAYLQIPYLIWVAFAAVLNFSIFLLNK